MTMTSTPRGTLSQLRGAAKLPTMPDTVRTAIGIAALGAALLVIAPLVLTDFRLNLLAKFVCYAIVAVGIGLAWGRGGMLTLGQGVFFGIGGYAMAMHLKLADASLDGGSGVPDFMLLYGDGTVPWWWEPFRSGAFTIGAIIVLPAIVALVLGLAVFKRRVKGAYFAILSQALVAAFVVLLVGQQPTTGGTNGLNGFRSFFGLALADSLNKRMLYFIAVGVLLLMMIVAFLLMRSRFGELLVATRDAEERVRFLGYDPAWIKTITFVVAGVMAGLAGALFVPIVGIISPADIGVVPSIGFVIGVAVGGRASLFGPVLGAIGVGWAETSLSEAFPSFWIYFQGLLLILVIAFLPGGIASIVTLARRRRGTARTEPKLAGVKHEPGDAPPGTTRGADKTPDQAAGGAEPRA